MNRIKHLKAVTVICIMISIISGGIINAAALEYGEEWKDSPMPVGRAGQNNYREEISALPFDDVPVTHWAFESIIYCRAKGWFDGYADNTFEPNETITRAEAIKVIDMYCGLPVDMSAVSTFTDVKPDAWYTPYIEAGKSLFPYKTELQGIRQIAPEEPITREDAVYILVNALNYDEYLNKADYSVLRQFSDEDDITYDIRPSMAVAVKYGIISGYNDGTIGPQKTIMRSEFAKILHQGSLSKAKY